MNPAKLEENTSAIEDIQRSTKEVETKLAIAEDARARERSTQLLLNYELSQMQNVIDETKKAIEELDREKKRLLMANQNASLQLKRIRNYFGYLSPLQVDRKAEWMQNLRGELNSLDFTIEEHEEEPSRSVETFTQVSRH